MIGQDRHHQQSRADCAKPHRLAAPHDRKRKRAKAHTARDRNRQQVRHPYDIGGHPQRGNSEIMHQGNGGAEDSTTDQWRPGPVAIGRGDKSDDHHDNRNAQRCNRHQKIERDRNSRRVSEHSDEVRRPNAATAHKTGRERPEQARRGLVIGSRALIHVDGRNAGQQANARSQKN